MQQAHYFRIGLFIVFGTVLIVMTIIAIGAGQFFQKTETMVTYLNESVNGLSIGSPVKFRGVQIGTVHDIGFQPLQDGGQGLRPRNDGFVIVHCRLDKNLYQSDSSEIVKRLLLADVKRGLRVRPTSSGITGQMFLNINFLNPNLNPPLDLGFEPKGLYIPSAPSTLSRLEGVFNTISRAVSKIDMNQVGGAVKDLRQAADGLGQFLKRGKLEELTQEMIDSLTSARRLIDRAGQLLAVTDAESIIPDAADSIRQVRLLAAELNHKAPPILKQAELALTDVQRIVGRVDRFSEQAVSADTGAQVKQMVAQLKTASKNINLASAQFTDLTGRLNAIVAGQQFNIQTILEDARLLLLNLRELSTDAKRYPSGVLFGEPPGRVEEVK